MRSLDRLYSQALLVAPRQHGRAAAWAAATGAALYPPPSGPGVGGLWGLEEWMRQGPVKEPERAVDKALACYGGDPSRLLDICRVRLVVAGPAQASAAIAAAVADRAMRVVRVRSSAGPGGERRLDDRFRVRQPSWRCCSRRHATIARLPPASHRRWRIFFYR